MRFGAGGWSWTMAAEDQETVQHLRARRMRKVPARREVTMCWIWAREARLQSGEEQTHSVVSFMHQLPSKHADAVFWTVYWLQLSVL